VYPEECKFNGNYTTCTTTVKGMHPLRFYLLIYFFLLVFFRKHFLSFIFGNQAS
jgi:hypothetical protein